jgi:hypothetical protein
MKENLSVSAFIVETRERLLQTQHTPLSLQKYETVWSELEQFVRDEHVPALTRELGATFLARRYGLVLGAELWPAARRDQNRLRAIEVLLDCQAHHPVSIRRRMTSTPFQGSWAPLMNAFVAYEKRAGRAARTMETHLLYLARFSEFLDAASVAGPAVLDARVLTEFVSQTGLDVSLFHGHRELGDDTLIPTEVNAMATKYDAAFKAQAVQLVTGGADVMGPSRTHGGTRTGPRKCRNGSRGAHEVVGMSGVRVGVEHPIPHANYDTPRGLPLEDDVLANPVLANRPTVSIPSHVAVIIDTSYDFFAMPEAMGAGPRRARSNIRGPSIYGALVRGPMNTHIGHGLDPGGDLAIQVGHPLNPMHPGPKVVPDITDRTFDLAFCLSPVRARGRGGEPMERGKCRKAGMPLDRGLSQKVVI